VIPQPFSPRIISRSLLVHSSTNGVRLALRHLGSLEQLLGVLPESRVVPRICWVQAGPLGLGRTGLVAACVLVAAGTPARTALEAVRRARPGAVEAAAQECFIEDFEAE
jgi:hypothetical protein